MHSFGSTSRCLQAQDSSPQCYVSGKRQVAKIILPQHQLMELILLITFVENELFFTPTIEFEIHVDHPYQPQVMIPLTFWIQSRRLIDWIEQSKYEFRCTARQRHGHEEVRSLPSYTTHHHVKVSCLKITLFYWKSSLHSVLEFDCASFCFEVDHEDSVHKKQRLGRMCEDYRHTFSRETRASSVSWIQRTGTNRPHYRWLLLRTLPC